MRIHRAALFREDTHFLPIFPWACICPFHPENTWAWDPVVGTAQALSQWSGPEPADTAPDALPKLRIKHGIKSQIWIFCFLLFLGAPTSQSKHCSPESSLPWFSV